MEEDMDMGIDSGAKESPQEEKDFELGFADPVGGRTAQLDDGIKGASPEHDDWDGEEDDSGNREEESKEEDGQDEEDSGDTDGEKGFDEGGEEEKSPEPGTMKVLFMGKETVVTPEELTSLVQKGLNHDRMAARLTELNKGEKLSRDFSALANYYGYSPEEFWQLTAGHFREEEVKRMMGEGLGEGQAREKWEQKLAAYTRADQPKPNGRERDIKAEIAGLIAERPYLRGLKAFPPQVARDINNGMEVREAYYKYENRRLLEAMRKHPDGNSNDSPETANRPHGVPVMPPRSQKGRGASDVRDLFMSGFSQDY